MKQWTILSAYIAAMVFLLLVRCTLPTGGATETGNAKITSMLYNPGGSPAVNAKVCFYPHDNDPRPGKGTGPVDSTTTDASGNYTAKLDSGVYNILATLGDKATFQDSIKAIKDSTMHPPADTLKALGSISGKIELHGSDDPRTVFILFMGSNTFTTVMDTQGNFSAANMAKGKYRVRILTTLDNYKVMDTAFEITAGTDSIIPVPIRLEYTGIPVVEGLRIAYDTLKEIVALTWNKPINGRVVQSYSIYRKRSDSASFMNIKGGVTDTSYSDSTGEQDQTYEYRVAVVDTNASEGTKSVGTMLHLIGVYQKVQTVLSINQPKGICLYTNGLLSVLDNAESSIAGFDTTGKTYTGKSIRDSTGKTVGGLRDLCFDTSGYYYMTSDAGILKYDSNGQYVVTFDSAIAPDVPYNIAIDDSTVFVTFSHAVKKYNKQGRFITQWANDEFALGYVREPGGIALSGDTVFVFDELNAQVQLYSKLGVFLSAWGVQGEKDGQFTQFMSKIMIDAGGKLFVAQQTSTALKVQFFTKSGQYLGKFLAGIINDAPQGITLAKNNMLYLAIENQGTSASNISIFKKTSGF